MGSKVYSILFVIDLLLSIRCFNYYNFKVYQQFYWFLATALFIYSISKWNLIKKQYVPFYGLTLYLMFAPLITVTIKMFQVREADFVEYDFTVIRYIAFASFYLLYYFKVSEQWLVKTLTAITVIAFFIQIFQVIYPEYAIFAVRYEEGELLLGSSNRGFYRYFVMTEQCAIFCMVYYWSKILQRISFYNIIFFIISICSIYLMLTRQLLIVCVISIVVSLIFEQKKINYKISLFCGIIVGLIVINFDAIFGTLIQYSNDETYSVDIRKECISFFLAHSLADPLLLFTGHGGRPVELVVWGDSFGYWYSDIGMIGQLYQYGFIWVMVFYYTVYNFFTEYRHFVPNYIILYVFCMLLLSLTYAPYYSGMGPLLWCIILYISSLYIKSHNRIV